MSSASVVSTLLGVAAVLASVPQARAERWITAETPAAFAVSDAQEGAFRPGLMPALGAYADRGRLALGVRLRAGLLRNGPPPGPGIDDPGRGGLATATAAARLLVGRAWIEGAGGGGITGRTAVPTVELGAGIHLSVFGVQVGPSLRYVRLIGSDPASTFGTADLVLAGLDVRFGGRPPRDRATAPVVARAAATAPVAPAPAPSPPPPPAEPDPDRGVDLDASCAELPDGCPSIDEAAAVATGRIVLEDQVMFELNGARIRATGRVAIARIAELWRRHPEWRRVTVEGHACELGNDAVNQRLSEARAASARAALLARGIDPERVETVGHGRRRPRDPGHTDAARARNRRVEFVIDRSNLEASATHSAQRDRP
jgi:outer membrane protein OmpA-like peptidoglycan-associated protein